MTRRLLAACDDFWSASGLSGRILLVWLLLVSAEAHAQSFVETLADANRQELSTHATWLKLLHFERGQKQSAMLDDEFFLAPSGRTDPAAELVATLRAYFEETGAGGDEHPRCRFPARYFWLSTKLDLPGYDPKARGCARLTDWALLDQTNSISFLLVSGYLGNPASTFGHSLVRLNSDSPDDREGLFDLGLNYGALVPPRENPLLYIFRGLTGRYDAGFSDKYFYTQDLVYSRTEFRDMWDYRLNLSEFQRTLLILHVWELVGKKFRYYFLDKNCGYRIAELIELVLDDELLDRVGNWYVPVEMFHRLHELDRERVKNGEEPLIASVDYIPSSRRKLFRELELLTDDEMNIVDRFAETEPGSLGSMLDPLSEDRRTTVLDGLLAYQQYRITVDRPDSLDVAWEKKREILLERLQMPRRDRRSSEIPELRSPALGFRPSVLSLSATREESDFDYGEFSWSGFKKESIGRNSLEGNEMVFLDVSLGVADDAPAVFLNHLDFLNILSLNAPGSRVSGDRALSWRLRTRIERHRWDGEHDYDGLFSFGVGRAWHIGSRIKLFGILNGEAHTDSPKVRMLPELGLLLGWSRLRARAGYELQSEDYSGAFEERWNARVMLHLGERYSLQVEVREAVTHVLSVGVSRYY